MPSNTPPVEISDAESIVMQVLWQRSPRSAEEVVSALQGQQLWQEATIKTLLNRLLNKGAISADKDGRRFLYTPLLQREQWLSRESENLLDRLFDGQVAPLVAHFGKHRKLSAHDIAALKRLLNDLDADTAATGDSTDDHR